MRTICSSWENCRAPLCPLDKESLQNGVWFPDEDVCNGHFIKPHFIYIQRKVAKKAQVRDRCFTMRMLASRKRVENPRGIDPDRKLTSLKKVALPRGRKKRRVKSG